MGAPAAGRCSRNHATWTRLVYGRLVAAGRPLGRPLRWFRSGHVVRRSS